MTGDGGYVRNDRGWRLRSEYLMRVATLTTWHENRRDPPERVRRLDSCPSGYGVTFLRRNDGVGAVLWLYSQQ